MTEPDEQAEPVYCLVYASAATKEVETEELEEILAVARENNTRANITGMLVYYDGSFLQALEGEEASVMALYEKIETDERHTDALILFRGELEGRQFEGWRMGFARPDPSDAPKGYSDFIRRGFRGNAADDGEIARRLLLEFREGRWRRGVEAG